MKFKIEKSSLCDINVPNVKLNSKTENKVAKELTSNCGCGGTCLSTTT